MDPERARHALDHTGALTDLGLGASIEAFSIAAESRGYALEGAHVTPGEKALLRFRPISPAPGAAARLDALRRRATDRRPYRGGDVADRTLRARLAEIVLPEGVSLHAAPRLEGAVAAWAREALALGWHVPGAWADTARWARHTDDEWRSTRDGVHTRNLGLPGLAPPAWAWGARAHRLGAALGGDVAWAGWMSHLLASSAGFLAVAVRSPGRPERVAAGRALLAAWVVLTGLGWAAQPIFELAVPFSGGAASEPTLPPGAPDRFRAVFRRGREPMFTHLGLPDGAFPAWLLRIGTPPRRPLPRPTLRLPGEEPVRAG